MDTKFPKDLKYINKTKHYFFVAKKLHWKCNLI